METISNQRAYNRFNIVAPIMYASEENCYAYYGAKTLNYSRGGLCFLTPYPLQQGMVISIRKADHTPKSKVTSKYTERIAEVRWCKEIFSKDKRAFGAGVMFQTQVSNGKPFFVNGH